MELGNNYQILALRFMNNMFCEKCSEWIVDYHPPDGADREGWQYATDFPSSYRSYKGPFDYVRRRRWQRKCRFSSTGPWFQFGLTKLLDISMQVHANIV